MLGGKVSADGVQFARQVVPLPAKRIPAALHALLEFYKQNRAEGESFREWAVRTPDDAVISKLQPFVAAADDEHDLFVDWGDNGTYSLKLGRGECGA